MDISALITEHGLAIAMLVVALIVIGVLFRMLIGSFKDRFADRDKHAETLETIAQNYNIATTAATRALDDNTKQLDMARTGR